MEFYLLTDKYSVPDEGFEYITTKLDRGERYFASVILPKGCKPRKVTTLFYKSKDGRYNICLSVPFPTAENIKHIALLEVKYPGSDAAFARLCESRKMSFDTMQEMISFLRSMKLK